MAIFCVYGIPVEIVEAHQVPGHEANPLDTMVSYKYQGDGFSYVGTLGELRADKGVPELMKAAKEVNPELTF